MEHGVYCVLRIDDGNCMLVIGYEQNLDTQYHQKESNNSKCEC